MSLIFSGRSGSLEERWITYALLRDAVQHHLEGGRPSSRFAVLHSVTRALGNPTISVSAQGLHQELEVARTELLSRPISDLALSERTRAATTLVWSPDLADATALVKDLGSELPLLSGNPHTLGDVFGHFVESLLEITSGAGPEEKIEIHDA